MEASLPYHEPSITTIAVLSGFLILLNLINHGLDKLAYCGLIGQVAIGIAWGTPGSKWLSRDVESAVVQLGYLGLILVVFEGQFNLPVSISPTNSFHRRPFNFFQISKS
jgi:hypothetical protein